MTDASVAAALVAEGGGTSDGVAWGRGEREHRPATWVARGVPSAESATEGSGEAVLVVVADVAAPRVGAPAESPPPMSGVIPMPIRVERVAGVGGAACAGAMVARTCPSCGPEAAEPLFDGPLLGLNKPSGVAVVTTLRSAREVRLESTVVRVASARLRGPASDAELVPTGTREAEDPLDSVAGPIVAASAEFA